MDRSANQKPRDGHWAYFLWSGIEADTLNMSRFAPLNRSSNLEVERGLEASLSDNTMTSGDGVSPARSWSLMEDTTDDDHGAHGPAGIYMYRSVITPVPIT